MAYCNQIQVELTLAQSLTTANPSNLSTPAKLSNLGTRASTFTIPPESFQFFMSQSDSIINAALSQQYVIPLIEKCDLQMKLTSPISEYSDVIFVDDFANLEVGDTLIITDGVNQDKLVVSTINYNSSFLVETMPVNSYEFGSRVLRVRFPDPIPYIAARLTAASIYDKHLKAQTDPGKSDYGDMLRKNAINDLNNIREGRTILKAQRVGWRFANPNLITRYTVKGALEQDGTLSEPNQ